MSWIETTFLIDPTWLAAATWLGLLATVGGFWFTLVQVFKARRASEAAREATRRTTNILRTRQTLTSMSDGNAQLQQARSYIKSGNYETAEHCLRHVHRFFAELKGEHLADPFRTKVIQ